MFVPVLRMRYVTLARPAAATVVVALAALLFLGAEPQPAAAHHLCGATGSPFGPFDLQTYEDGNYRTTYARTMELAGFNQLFPELPSFALPALETGDRSAGSAQPVAPYIPPVLLKSIGWIESGWAQGSYDPLVQYGEVGPVLSSHDCGYGIMQVTSGMQNITGVPTLDQTMIGGHYAFNIARGARILADKWNQAPEYRPIVGNRDPHLIENWYYALWAYNGFAFKNHPMNPAYAWPRPAYDCQSARNYPYQELVLGCAQNPPYRAGAPLWDAQPVHIPDLADPAFGGPLALQNWAPCSQSLVCAPMDMPTPNPNHQDPVTPALTRAQVIGEPVMSVSPGSVELTAFPVRQSRSELLTISNSGTGVLAWRASSSTPWLKLSRIQGVSTGTDLGSTGQTLSVHADAVSLPPGTYTGDVKIESLYAKGGAVVVPVTLRVNSGDEIWKTGDFNGDGKTDLAHLCCFDTMAVWLSHGDGTFTVTTFQPWPDYWIQAGTWQTGDFNGDGKTDLAHLCCFGSMAVWLSLGDGSFTVTTFQPWSDYWIQAGTWEAGDFNGDGKTDLAHLCCSNNAAIWLSRGDGSFDVSVVEPWPGYGVRTGSWETGDFNGDGKTDLAHLCCPNYSHTWLSRGDGSFDVATFGPWPGYGIYTGSWETGDFNGDGKTDLAHVCCADYAHTWLAVGNGSFDITTFQPWPGYGVLTGLWRTGDFNGDGKTDLAHLCCFDYMHTWLSNGDGNFAVTKFQPWPDYWVNPP